jgi:DNA-binding LacI/PurR family transcriptional regulator
MAVTLREVAAKVGVTPVVVSRVLHNKANGIRVSEATAQRIRDAAEELGYRVNVWARNFRAQQTMTIGVLHGAGFPRPLFDQGARYFAALMDGIVEGAFRHGYSVSLCPKLLGSDPQDAMNDGRFDGLVWYSSSPSPEMKEAMIRSHAPIVALHAKASEYDGRMPTVRCDNRMGIRLGLEHLASLGHRRIAYANEAQLNSEEAIDRLDCFLKLAPEAKEKDIIQVGFDRSEIHSFLSRPLEHTAIVCFNEGLAADLIQAAPKHDVNLPDDLSIMGFDSTAYCNELRPELTSISQPLAKIGETAIDVLVKRINGEPVELMETVLQCGLDIRNSTTAPRA